MPHYVLDARTATPHFPGIGRYVTNLARALALHLRAGERLTILHDPTHPLLLPPHEAVRALPVPISPFTVQQQWAIPRWLRRLNATYHKVLDYLMPYRPAPV